MGTSTLLPTRGSLLDLGGSPAGVEPVGLPTTRPVLDVVISEYGEERDVEPSVRRTLTHRRRVDLAGLRRRRPAGSPILREALTFGAIGVASTLAYTVLYTLLREAFDAPAANAIALVVTAVGNTAANRQFTFGVRGRASMLRDQVAGLVAFGIALLLTSVSIAALDLVAPDAGRAVELAVLIAANAAATVTRFLLLRTWISQAPRGSLRPAEPERTVR